MAGNTIGKLFTVTTSGESHGPGLSAIIDGCPPGLEIDEGDIQKDLNIPVAVTYDRRNDEFDVVMKTIMRKKNFRSPDKFINYK